MRGRRTAIGAVLALAVVAAMVVSSAGASPKQEFKMAIFTDIGTLQDRSFNQLANEGRIAVGKQLGIQTLTDSKDADLPVFGPAYTREQSSTRMPAASRVRPRSTSSSVSSIQMRPSASSATSSTSSRPTAR